MHAGLMRRRQRRIFEMSRSRGQTWSVDETEALIEIWKDDRINGLLRATHKNSAVFRIFSERMEARGFQRTLSQCRVKVKKLRMVYTRVRDKMRQSGGGPCDEKDDFQWYDDLDMILGHRPTLCSPKDEPTEVEVSSHAAPIEDDDESHETPSVTGHPEIVAGHPESGFPEAVRIPDGSVDLILMDLMESAKNESPRPPPRKRARKNARLQQMSEDLQKLFGEMDREYYRREDLRLQEQREYEERLRKQAMEREERERTWQMAMFRDMQETQVKLFREVLGVLRQPAPRHPFDPTDRQHHGPDLHYNGFNASAFHEAVRGGSPATHGMSEGRSSFAYEMLKSVSDWTPLLHMGHNAERATQTCKCLASQSERHHQQSQTENEAEERPQPVAEERIKQEAEERPQPLSEEKIKQEQEENIKQVVI